MDSKIQVKYEIRMIPISQIFPYENNPREISDNAVEGVAASIDDVGFRQNLVLWPNPKNGNRLEIVAGHTRLLASKKLGLVELPCLVADHLTEEQAQRYRIIDNKSGELADWDFEKLHYELKNMDRYHEVFLKNFTRFERDVIFDADWITDADRAKIDGLEPTDDVARARLNVDCDIMQKEALIARIREALEGFEGAFVS